MREEVPQQAVPAVAEVRLGPMPPIVRVPSRKQPIKHPSSDGKRMADNIEQERTMNYNGGTLRAHFRACKDILVAVHLLVYYLEGDEETRLVRDVMMVRGVSSGLRGSYRVWEEGKAAEFVVEVLSNSTEANDQGDKRKAWAQMGVLEYFRYDPRSQIMARQLGGRWRIGERLVGASYRELARVTDDSIHSEVLGLDRRVRRRETEPSWRELRLRDPATGEDLPTPEEECEQLIAAKRPIAELEARLGLRDGHKIAEEPHGFVVDAECAALIEVRNH